MTAGPRPARRSAAGGSPTPWDRALVRLARGPEMRAWPGTAVGFRATFPRPDGRPAFPWSEGGSRADQGVPCPPGRPSPARVRAAKRAAPTAASDEGIAGPRPKPSSEEIQTIPREIASATATEPTTNCSRPGRNRHQANTRFAIMLHLPLPKAADLSLTTRGRSPRNSGFESQEPFATRLNVRPGD